MSPQARRAGGQGGGASSGRGSGAARGGSAAGRGGSTAGRGSTSGRGASAAGRGGAPARGGAAGGQARGAGKGGTAAGRPSAGKPVAGKAAAGRPAAGKPVTGKAPAGKGAQKPVAGKAGVGKGTARGAAPRSAASSRGPALGRPGAPWPPKTAPARHRTPRPPIEDLDVHDPAGVRLQKVLATAGLGSRRACEELIADGRVEVDGQVVTELGVRVDPKSAVIHVDGLRVQLDASVVTIALNKPKGFLSTMDDPEGRPTIAQFIQNREERLFHIGRLDADSEGLILLTNDGELANRLSHPSSGVAKTYLVEVEGKVAPSLPARLKRGIELEDGPVAVDEMKIVQAVTHASLVEVVIHEGRNRIVRRIFDEVGHPVTKLVRTRIGPIRLGDLKPGRTRVLGKTEVGSLMTSVGL
jgi:23S rRNA pseudouridine2605 synthase